MDKLITRIDYSRASVILAVRLAMVGMGDRLLIKRTGFSSSQLHLRLRRAYNAMNGATRSKKDGRTIPQGFRIDYRLGESDVASLVIKRTEKILSQQVVRGIQPLLNKANTKGRK